MINPFRAQSDSFKHNTSFVSRLSTIRRHKTANTNQFSPVTRHPPTSMQASSPAANCDTNTYQSQPTTRFELDGSQARRPTTNTNEPTQSGQLLVVQSDSSSRSDTRLVRSGSVRCVSERAVDLSGQDSLSVAESGMATLPSGKRTTITSNRSIRTSTTGPNESQPVQEPEPNAATLRASNSISAGTGAASYSASASTNHQATRLATKRNSEGECDFAIDMSRMQMKFPTTCSHCLAHPSFNISFA